jgi:hypothetical protein
MSKKLTKVRRPCQLFQKTRSIKNTLLNKSQTYFNWVFLYPKTI